MLIFNFTAFSQDMVDDGYEDVVNIDISSVVIDAMRNKHSTRPQLKCILFFKSFFGHDDDSYLLMCFNFFYSRSFNSIELIGTHGELA